MRCADKYKKTIGVDFLEKEAYVASVDQTITFMVRTAVGLVWAQLVLRFERGTEGDMGLGLLLWNVHRRHQHNSYDMNAVHAASKSRIP